MRIVLADGGLARSRPTVFFRLLLGVPHYLWIAAWGIAAVAAALVNWIWTSAAGSSPPALHGFLARFVRYTVHVEAYLLVAADPYPPFDGRSAYPVTLEIDPPAPQPRWSAALRPLLALPALLVSSALTGGAGWGRSTGYGSSAGAGATASAGAWFASVATGRCPRGCRDAIVYSLGYGAQAWAYAFLLTPRYPDAAPAAHAVGSEAAGRPVSLSVDDDLRRSRLTVFFRLLLAVPHLVWLVLWTPAAWLAAVAAWLVALARTTVPEPLHRFLAAYVRYTTHVYAFLALVANPFPGFVGAAGGYPVDLRLPEPRPHGRASVGFRVFLALPPLVMAGALSNLLVAAALLEWFHALALGRASRGLRDAAAYALRYSAEANAYLYLLTETYPDCGPWVAADEAPPAVEAVAAVAA